MTLPTLVTTTLDAYVDTISLVRLVEGAACIPASDVAKALCWATLAQATLKSMTSEPALSDRTCGAGGRWA